MRRMLWQLLLLSLVFVSFFSSAGVVLTGTRLIYPADKKEVTINLRNTSDTAVLVQSWIDTGDPMVMPDKINAPFVIMPPIARIDGLKIKTLRIIYTGGKLATDRESIFWLNVLAVPPKSRDENSQVLNVAYQNRIKVFLRPEGLKENVKLAVKNIKWIHDGKKVTVHNPTPYYVSFASVCMGSKSQLASFEGKMVAPFSQLSSQEDITTLSNKREVHYKIIDDFGSVIENSSHLQ